MRSCCTSLVVAMLVVFVSAVAEAQTFPSKPITVIYPNPPGGLAEQSIRQIGERFEKRTGQPFIIEFRPGGLEVIAMQATLAAPADGHTMVSTNQNIAVNPAFTRLPYETRDFAPIITYALFAPTISVRAALPA